MPYTFIQDEYKKSRGHSKLLELTCEDCGAHICYYQKDGPGPLKRMYVDRIVGGQTKGQRLKCPKDGFVLGELITYEKEDRPAYRLYQSAVLQKHVNSRTAIL